MNKLLIFMFLILSYILIITRPYLKYFSKVKFPKCTDDIPYLTKFKCLKYMDDNFKNINPKITDYICSSDTPKKIKGLKQVPFWDIKNINKYLLSNKEIILKELNNLSIENKFENIGDHAYNQNDSKYLNINWKAFHLIKSFKENEIAKKLCPKTMNIVKNTPDFFGNAFFSALKGGAKIPKHIGPINIKLTCLLGLKNLEKSIFKVNGIAKEWKENDIIIFDDSCEHEVENYGKTTRVVLIIDILHPDLKEDEKYLLKSLYEKF